MEKTNQGYRARYWGLMPHCFWYQLTHAVLQNGHKRDVVLYGLYGLVTLKFYSDHCPDNVKFPDNSTTVRSTPAHVKCYSYHASTSVIVSGGVGMQQCTIQNQNEMYTLCFKNKFTLLLFAITKSHVDRFQ